MKENELSEEYYEELRRVVEANGDLRARACGNLHAFYDEDDDLFTLTIGRDEGALSLFVENVLVLRYDEETFKVIAFELYHFHELLAERSPFVRLVFGLMEHCGPVDMKLYPEPDFEAQFTLLASLKQAS